MSPGWCTAPDTCSRTKSAAAATPLDTTHGVPAGKRFVDDQPPALPSAGHGHAISRRERAGHGRLIQEATPCHPDVHPLRGVARRVHQRTVARHGHDDSGAKSRGSLDDVQRPLALDELSREQHQEVAGARAHFLPRPVTCGALPDGCGAGREVRVVHAVWRIEDQRLGRPEVTKVFTDRRADAEIPVEHLQRRACPDRPGQPYETSRSAQQVAVAAIEDRDVRAPAGGDRAEVEHRMPAGHDDGVGPRRDNRVTNRADVRAREAVGIEPPAGMRLGEHVDAYNPASD